MIHVGDITKLSGHDLEPVDCICGGSPCQDLSVAGKRVGLAGERSGLFMEQIRIIKEMRDGCRRANVDIRPRWMVWENVPGAFSSNGGEDFRAVLEETARITEKDAVIPGPPKGKWTPSGCIMGDGWSIAWRVHDAQFWGVPQRRKRIALVADFAGGGAPEVLFECKSLSGDFEPCGEKREDPAGEASESFEDASGRIKCYGISSYASNAMRSDNPHSGIYQADTARTLDNNGGNPACNQGGMIVLDARGNGDGNICPTITGDHENRITDYTAITFTTEMTPKVDEKGTAFSLRSRDYKDAPCVTYGLDRAAFNQGINAQYDFQIDEEKIGTQVAKGPGAVYTKGDNYAGAQNKVLRLLWETYGAQTILDWGTSIVATLQQANVLRQGVHEGSISGKTENRQKLDDSTLPCPSVVVGWLLRDMWEREECGCSSQRWKSTEQRIEQSNEGMPELSQQNPQTCAEMFDMWEKGQGLWLLREALSEVQKIRQSIDVPRSVIRRLTPLEVERLQGFPDHWTDIGEWVDSKGKKRKDADSPRYKALGNSIALPFWFWLLRRISATYCRPATLGSLFDGIGGFPLCWERCNGKGTARWASEIEEFPIAVTKRHFGEE